MISTSKRKNRQKLNWIRLAEHGRIPVGVKYSNPRITFDGLNWFICVAVEFESEKSQAAAEPLGIDLEIERDLQAAINLRNYPFVSGEFKPVECHTKRE